MAEVAVNYVRTSVPDALAALKPRAEELMEMALAKLEEGRPDEVGQTAQRRTQRRSSEPQTRHVEVLVTTRR